MWLELLSIFRKGDAMETLAGEFREMLQLLKEMSQIVKGHIFDQDLSLDDRSKVYKLDVRVNKLERSIRKRVVSHVTLSRDHVPYCLLLMTLVKDAERIGDYWKNISEVSTLGAGKVPEGELKAELREIIDLAMTLMNDLVPILDSSDRERAEELLQIARLTGKRCDQLLVELAKSDFQAAETTAMVLLTRFHKRIIGHSFNILSSVVMPLHKVDFYAEQFLESTTPSDV
jgi:phosphate transport system protein